MRDPFNKCHVSLWYSSKKDHMKQAQSTILAVGAAGKFAGLVLPALAQRGAKVRGLIRRASDAEEVRAHGATDVAVGDLGDRATVNAALDGIGSAFSIEPTLSAR